MNNENWGCMKCGNINDAENMFCEYCGGARPVDPIAVLKEKARGFMKQVGDQVVTLAQKKKCSSCGTLCSADDQFCFNCASRLDGSDTSVPMQEIVPLEPPVLQNIVCLHCGAMNPDNLRFCNACGEEIRKEEVVQPKSETQSVTSGTMNCCPNCGARQFPGAVFCDECGAKIVRGNDYQMSYIDG